MTTQTPLQTNAERQRAYRRRKKKAAIYAANYPYQYLLKLSANLDLKDNLLEAANECYDLGGEKLLTRFCCLCNHVLSTHLCLQTIQARQHPRKNNNA